MVSNLEKAQFMSILARGKSNLGEKYDRLEHFKRFQNLKEIVKELSKQGWIIIHNKPGFTAVSLNTNYKKEIIEFIEFNMPESRGMIK
ncbi:hypothetical protein HYW74_02315 [Candidatus Pacearchaeota archaeon]|nr:hypothetical protein [Candidatus Pacearchaeota archaeon]